MFIIRDEPTNEDRERIFESGENDNGAKPMENKTSQELRSTWS